MLVYASSPSSSSSIIIHHHPSSSIIIHHHPSVPPLHRPPVVHVFSEGQPSQNRGLLDLPRTSRVHDSACHDVARRIVGTRGPGEVWETSILRGLDLHLWSARAHVFMYGCPTDGGAHLTQSRSSRPPPDLPSPRFYVPRRGTQNRGDESPRG